MNYMYPIPAGKLLEFVGKKIRLAWASLNNEYTLVKVEGSSIHTEDSFGVKGKFNAKDACYVKGFKP